MGRDRHLLTEYFNRFEEREVWPVTMELRVEPSTYKSAVSRTLRGRVIRLLHLTQNSITTNVLSRLTARSLFHRLIIETWRRSNTLSISIRG